MALPASSLGSENKNEHSDLELRRAAYEQCGPLLNPISLSSGGSGNGMSADVPAGRQVHCGTGRAPWLLYSGNRLTGMSLEFSERPLCQLSSWALSSPLPSPRY